MKNVENLAYISMGDFSEAPYGRFPTDGKFSGERFRDEKLLPEINNKNIKKISINLDSVREGYEYGSSFLEEVFGGLIRVHGIEKKELLEKVEIITKHKDYIIEIKDYIEKA